MMIEDSKIGEVLFNPTQEQLDSFAIQAANKGLILIYFPEDKMIVTVEKGMP